MFLVPAEDLKLDPCKAQNSDFQLQFIVII